MFYSSDSWYQGRGLWWIHYIFLGSFQVLAPRERREKALYHATFFLLNWNVRNGKRNESGSRIAGRGTALLNFDVLGNGRQFPGTRVAKRSPAFTELAGRAKVFRRTSMAVYLYVRDAVKSLLSYGDPMNKWPPKHPIINGLAQRFRSSLAQVLQMKGCG